VKLFRIRRKSTGGGEGGGVQYSIDPHHFNADPDSAFHFYADLDPNFTLIRTQIRIRNPVQYTEVLNALPVVI
jgi:hypothetical protein